jgi:RNA polymerase sigma-70 factor, ECF subfamily
MGPAAIRDACGPELLMCRIYVSGRVSPVDETVPEAEGSPRTTPRAQLGAPLADLLRRSGRGDEAAFAELYDATSSRVVGMAVRVVRDPAQAEEVAQEAFLDIWKNSGRFDPAKGSPLGWLLTIVHRKAVDRVRSAEASTRRDTSYHSQNQPIDHDSTAEAATASMEGHRVRTALLSLTAVQREALELAYFGGYTHTEVATMLDLPVGTAKTRIRDGLIRLRDTMGVGA